MASSSTSSDQKSFKYQLFLSFRGEVTRKTFVDHLYTSLKQLGIHTFRDNEELEKGKQIDELFKAIEESKFFIIVFSKNYASSSWCLKEVTKIMECQDGNQQIAYPLFYDVEPSDIRYQTGPVGRAIAKHKTNEQIKKWERALEGAGNLVGWDLKNISNGHEAEAIDQIVKEVSLKLGLVHLWEDENFVGMERRMQKIESSLGIGLNDEVRMIGIKGMGGIGKTTLARYIFDKLSSEFEGKSFVEVVREASKELGGLLSLQRQVLQDVFGVYSAAPNATLIMKTRMRLKKFLLVLDDVDHKDQLEALAGALDWFKGGSRIIITTRDKQVLRAHRVNMIDDVNLLSDEEAFSLFKRYAFERYIIDKGYEDLSSKVVKYAAGLPLTLKVLGSFLLGKEKSAWTDTLNRLKTIPWDETQDILKVSYDGLKNDQKEIFLDVACFMKGMLKEDAIRMLESRGFHAIVGLAVLEEQSLITISNHCLAMHDSIQELGRFIVRGSHPEEPNKHSRLWIPAEIEALLSDDKVNEPTTQCKRVKQLHLSPEIIIKGLGKLKNLKLLTLSLRDNNCPLDKGVFDQDNFSNSLQFLRWDRYPGTSLPQTFQANNLVGLELPFSKITKLWESGEREVLKKLRFLDLSNSKLKTLDLEMTPNLERLDLQGCHDLTEIHAPARCFKRIVYINLMRLDYFSLIQQLESLELLSLSKLQVTVTSVGASPSYLLNNLRKLSFRCFYHEESSQKSVILYLRRGTKLGSVSGIFFGLHHLRHLTFDGPIPELPNDLHALANLEELILVHTHIKCLPDSICMLKHLKSLKLDECAFLEELPRDLGQLVCLEKLTLHRCKSITHLPDRICMLKHLKSLILEECDFLEELPRDLGQLVCLEKLTLSYLKQITRLPDSICKMTNLKYIQLMSCSCLKELPEDLGQLECLEELILTYCSSLKDIPKSICNMKILISLNIIGTHIFKLPERISLLKGLRIHGHKSRFYSCDPAIRVKPYFCSDDCCYHIQAVDNKKA